MEKTLDGNATIRLVKGDITQVESGAICNAANAALAGGGGVDGAIHRAGGPSIMRELDRIREQQGGCPTGSAVATGAGDLPAQFVFHAVGPVYRGGCHGEAELLASAYRACMALARERGVSRIAFPSISTGIYGYPLAEAAPIAVRTVMDELGCAGNTVAEVIFVLFDDLTLEAFRLALE